MADEKIVVGDLTFAQITALYAQYGSESATANALGIPRTTLQSHYYKVKTEKFTSRRMREARQVNPEPNAVRYFIVTSAQDDTEADLPFLLNLEAYAKFRDAEIIVSGFTYNKRLFEENRKDEEHNENIHYDPAIAGYLVHNRILVGQGLMICNEMNTLPTAVTPLSGFETYTGDRWGIFPHPKIHLKSIPTAKNDFTKIIMTTGAITKPNYVQKKAGIKAEFFHELGAVVVALLPNGKFFARHLIPDDTGTFYDLKYRVQDGAVQYGDWVEAVNWGDIHIEKEEPEITKYLFDTDHEGDRLAMVDYLRPKYQFMHDTTDFTYRNHHNTSDPHFMYRMFVAGTESVRMSVRKSYEFLLRAYRPFAETIVVESNHDLALLKWLKTADYRQDPVNAEYFLQLQTQVYRSIRERTDFQVFRWALEMEGPLPGTTFLREDDSFVIVGDIECAMHGHNGANGAKPTPKQFTRMGKKSNTGHTHSANVEDGCYTAGVSGSLDMGYNKGLSSWSHSHIVTLINGKRTIVTQLPDGHYCEDVWMMANAV